MIVCLLDWLLVYCGSNFVVFMVMVLLVSYSLRCSCLMIVVGV